MLGTWDLQLSCKCCLPWAEDLVGCDTSPEILLSLEMMDSRKVMAGYLWNVAFIVGACSVLGQGTCGANGAVLLESIEGRVSAMFVFGDSVLDAGTNSLFPSLLQADYNPYGLTYFGKPTGRFTNGRTYADFFAEKIGLHFPEPYLKRQGRWGIIQGVNYASAGSGVFRATNAESQIIPFTDQFLQFEQTKISIIQTLKSESAAECLFSKSLFVINIGGNDVVTYFFNPALPVGNFLKNVMDVIEESVGTVYKAGGRKFILLGTGPIGCVPGLLAPAGVKDGTCLESANDLAKAYNTALEELVLNRLPEVFKDIKAIVGKPFEAFYGFINNGTAVGFTQGVKACCGSGLYNAEFQCGRPSDKIKNPPYNLCDDVGAHVFWDYFHPTERAYGIVAEKFWYGDKDVIAPMNLHALVNL